MDNQLHTFRIADFDICIRFADGRNNMLLLPSFRPFVSEGVSDDSNILFRLTVADQTRPVERERRKRIRAFDTGNGETVVDRIDDGGYQYIIKDIKGSECALLIANKDFSDCRCALKGNYDMRTFGLNNALMLAFAFAGSRRQTLLIHASLVRNNGYGYAFIAKSGTGKSTQVSMWLRYIPGSDLMNDDNPIIRIIDGQPFIFGGPWSGKTPCYRNIKAPLGAITRIDRAPENSIEQLVPIEAFASVLPACSTMKWDCEIYNHICDAITRIVETTGVYTLHCRPDEEAARVCYQEIAR